MQVNSQGFVFFYMVKIDEDAYWPNNLSLFNIDCEHYQGQKKQKYGENKVPWFFPKLGQ